MSMVFVTGGRPSYRDYVWLAHVVRDDRETAVELHAWLSLTDWDRRHYATVAAEDFPDRDRR